MKVRKKPVEVEAMQYDGLDSLPALSEFTNEVLHFHQGVVTIPTLEGRMVASPGDWIIKGVNGEFYPCKPDIFEKTYDIIES